ncbi:hypothetical protein BC941DRAFT_425998 [Chlamydoabsidia padenii]|nr:hypothetical protein BC941DRAFT_425998 [Chlamydoabsidia padenii]
MTYLPSPPTSPLLASATEKVLCGSCDRALGTDWFCSSCHTKCSTCNRFLTGQEYCTRCWLYDHGHRTLIRKRNISSSSTSSVASTAASVAASFRMMIPSPTTSSSSLQNHEDDYHIYHSYF